MVSVGLLLFFLYKNNLLLSLVLILLMLWSSILQVRIVGAGAVCVNIQIITRFTIIRNFNIITKCPWLLYLIDP